MQAIAGIANRVAPAYHYARPAVVALFQHRQVQSAAFVVAGAIGTKIGQSLGFFQESNQVLNQMQSSFPGFSKIDMTNKAEIVEKIKELANNFAKLETQNTNLETKKQKYANTYNGARETANTLLESSGDAVKDSIVKDASLSKMPDIDSEHAAVHLANWVGEAGRCHVDKVIATSTVVKQETKIKDLEGEMKNLRDDLETAKATTRKLETQKQKYANTYNGARETANKRLQSSGDAVRDSMKGASLPELPDIDSEYSAVHLANWVGEAGRCHADKVEVSNKLEKQEKKVDDLEKDIKKLTEDIKKLTKDLGAAKATILEKEKEIGRLNTDHAQAIGDLKRDKDVCLTEKDNYKDKFDTCENRGFVKRTFCWVT